jgi:hypothetical protein
VFTHFFLFAIFRDFDLFRDFDVFRDFDLFRDFDFFRDSSFFGVFGLFSAPVASRNRTCACACVHARAGHLFTNVLLVPHLCGILANEA